MNRVIGVAVVGVALLAAACVSTGEVDGYKIRAKGATTVTQTRVTHTGIHASAPRWFKDGWRHYLTTANDRYAVLAVDRNARGWGFVYCRASDCYLLEGAGHESWKDVRYKHKALNLCRENVKEYYPAYRPKCAIYAIGDKIVWKGPLPWE